MIEALCEGLGSKKMNQTEFLPREFSWRTFSMKPGRDMKCPRKEEFPVIELIGVDK